MIINVIKGVDDEIEFKGFKGRYFYMLAIAEVSLLLVTFLCYALGLSHFLFLFVAFGIGIGIFFYIKSMQDKFGKDGHIKNQHENMKPKYLLINKPFYKMNK